MKFIRANNDLGFLEAPCNERRETLQRVERGYALLDRQQRKEEGCPFVIADDGNVSGSLSHFSVVQNLAGIDRMPKKQPTEPMELKAPQCP